MKSPLIAKVDHRPTQQMKMRFRRSGHTKIQNLLMKFIYCPTINTEALGNLGLRPNNMRAYPAMPGMIAT